MLVHRKKLWKEIRAVIKEIDAEACRQKISREKRMQGELKYAPRCLNDKFKESFNRRGWKKRVNQFWTANDPKTLRQIYWREPDEQREVIKKKGLVALGSKNEIDFVKDKIAVEVQFGKYAFVAHDLFVKHLHFFATEIIEVGIEILRHRTMSCAARYLPRF